MSDKKQQNSPKTHSTRPRNEQRTSRNDLEATNTDSENHEGRNRGTDSGRRRNEDTNRDTHTNGRHRTENTQRRTRWDTTTNNTRHNPPNHSRHHMSSSTSISDLRYVIPEPSNHTTSRPKLPNIQRSQSTSDLRYSINQARSRPSRTPQHHPSYTAVRHNKSNPNKQEKDNETIVSTSTRSAPYTWHESRLIQQFQYNELINPHENFYVIGDSMLQHLSKIDDALVFSYPGITIAQLTCLIRRNIIPELWRARVVVALLGTNDVANTTSAADIMHDFYHLVQALRNYNPFLHIMLSTIIPRPRDYQNRDTVDNINQLLKDYAHTWNYTAVNTAEQYMPASYIITLFFRDYGIHLSEWGIARLERLIDELISTLTPYLGLATTYTQPHNTQVRRKKTPWQVVHDDHTPPTRRPITSTPWRPRRPARTTQNDLMISTAKANIRAQQLAQTIRPTPQLPATYQPRNTTPTIQTPSTNTQPSKSEDEETTSENETDTEQIQSTEPECESPEIDTGSSQENNEDINTVYDLVIPLTPNMEGVLSLQPISPITIEPAPIPTRTNHINLIDSNIPIDSPGLSLLSTYNPKSDSDSDSSEISFKSTYSHEQEPDVADICHSITTLIENSTSSTYNIIENDNTRAPNTLLENEQQSVSDTTNTNSPTDTYKPEVSPVSSCCGDEDMDQEDILNIHPEEDMEYL